MVSASAKSFLRASTSLSTKPRPASGQVDVAVGHLGEAQEGEGLGDREELVDFELQVFPELRQVGAAVVRRAGQLLHQAGEEVGGDRLELGVHRHSRAGGGGRPGRRDGRWGRRRRGWSGGRRPGRRAGGKRRSSRSRGWGMSTRISAATLAGLLERITTRSQSSTASSMLWVTMRMERSGRRPSVHSSTRSVRRVSAVRTVQSGERLVHEQKLRLHHERPREADALTHAAGELLRIGVLEAVQADEVDGGQGAGAALGGRQAQPPPARSPRWACTVSQGKSAKL